MTLVLVVVAAHEGEEFAIILPIIMLVGAFFILRWANKNDKDKTDEDAVEEPLPEARPVGFVLPKRELEHSEIDVRQETSV
ncbi:MAG TPA: hypothetical protein VKV73_02690 [Chloroflexota bacterium]|nr:hypothetical protein [Chloroflexota bacterium]